jgi:anti-sigma factor RsiW
VTCLEVRDRLVERSLGALHLDDVREVDRHLGWCAACRKEAAELDRAAATFALTLAPAAPDPDLEDRVVTAVHQAADSRASRRPSRRAAAATVMAAAIVVSTLGWGVSMAGRAERFKHEVADSQREQSAMFVRLQQLIGNEEFADRSSLAYLATLAPSTGRAGGGSALTWVSPTITDFAMVTVSGLPVGNKDALPYRVWVVNDVSGEQLPVGEPIRRLNADGGAMRVQDSTDLSGFRSVVVTDRRGVVVLRGTMGSQAVTASPSS